MVPSIPIIARFKYSTFPITPAPQFGFPHAAYSLPTTTGENTIAIYITADTIKNNHIFLSRSLVLCQPRTENFNGCSYLGLRQGCDSPRRGVVALLPSPTSDKLWVFRSRVFSWPCRVSWIFYTCTRRGFTFRERPAQQDASTRLMWPGSISGIRLLLSPPACLRHRHPPVLWWMWKTM